MERSGNLLGGRFRVVGVLGRGPTGEVVEARHGTLDRPCAVKILHPEVTADEGRVEAAFADLRAATAIGHPGIIDVFDTDRTDDGRSFFVMELLDGHSLASRLGGGRRLSPARAVEVVGEALAALAVAHRRGLVHGDLKLQNLYVTQRPGERPAVKILDFGASRLLATGGDRVARFAAPQFWSPEQATGGAEIDHRTDVYAMGAVLSVCLTGRPPFDSDDPPRTRARIVSRPFPDPRDLVPDLPDGLAAVVLRATAGHADRRYDSAEEMLAALGPFLSPQTRVRLGVAAGAASGEAAPADDGEAEGSSGDDDEGEEIRMNAPLVRPPSGRSVGFFLAVASGPLALAAVIGLLLVLQFRDRAEGDRAPSPAAPPTVIVQAPRAQECAPAAPQSAPAPRLSPEPVASLAAPPPPAPTVRLMLQNLPPGAVASVGGIRIEGGATIVPRSEGPLPVTVSAPGYEDVSLSVVPAADAVLAVAMRPVVPPSPAAPAAPAAPPPLPREPRAPAAPRFPSLPDDPFAAPPAGRGVGEGEPEEEETVATGTLRVRCNPWARVLIPGFGTRNTPFSLDLPAGQYNLLLANTSVPGESGPRRVSVLVEPGETTKVTSCW